jgi:hypothetical protein
MKVDLDPQPTPGNPTIEVDRLWFEQAMRFSDRIDALEASENQGVGNCGYIDPLFGLFEDDPPEKAAPWWVRLSPAGPITECQVWAAFVSWVCQPNRMWEWSGGKSSFTPKGQAFFDRVHEVTNEFAGVDTP